MRLRDARQEATGLVVNKKVNVKKEHYKLARSMCRQLITTKALREYGMLAFIYHVKQWDGEQRNVQVEETEQSCYRSATYAEF